MLWGNKNYREGAKKIDEIRKDTFNFAIQSEEKIVKSKKEQDQAILSVADNIGKIVGRLLSSRTIASRIIEEKVNTDF